MPESIFISVVLPLPFSPSRDRISPSYSSRFTSLFAMTLLPNRLVMFSILIAHFFSKAVILSFGADGCNTSNTPGINSIRLILPYMVSVVNQNQQKICQVYTKNVRLHKKESFSLCKSSKPRVGGKKQEVGCLCSPPRCGAICYSLRNLHYILVSSRLMPSICRSK